jgi:hypothetical protein
MFSSFKHSQKYDAATAAIIVSFVQALHAIYPEVKMLYSQPVRMFVDQEVQIKVLKISESRLRGSSYRGCTYLLVKSAG